MPNESGKITSDSSPVIVANCLNRLIEKTATLEKAVAGLNRQVAGLNRQVAELTYQIGVLSGDRS
jgi:serine protease inhibitor ecotin